MRKRKEMSLDDFLANESNKYFDLSGIKASQPYLDIVDETRRFFAYMTVAKKDNFYGEKEKNEFFANASEIVKEKAKTYGCVIDPDSNSELLQDIYKILWSDYINNGEKISGDTLNSTNTTLNVFYEYIEEELDKGKEIEKTEKYNREIKGKKQPLPVCIKFILSKYLIDEKSEIIQRILHNEELKKFLKSYHTLGNYMPIPHGCNSPRGIGATRDYWDLCLLHIYLYYKEGNYKGIEYMIGTECAKVYKDWLDSFGTWSNFVKRNYLEEFVNSEKEDYFPKELWKGHFSKDKSVLPNKEQCLEYFKNASNWILKRGDQMFRELKNYKSS